MAQCLAAKFSDPVLRQRLLATQGQLVDGHSGSPDLVWGYHIPSQQGENRLGHMLMDLRSKLYDSGENTDSTVVLFHGRYHLDWPVKCLHDGLPAAYAARIRDFAQGANLGGCIAVLPRRRICIALRGSSTDVESWERRMRTEHVDVNSRGKPCRERMLVELFRRTGSIRSTLGRTFDYQEVPDWAALCRCLSGLLGELPDIAAALGPEVPELPRYVTGPAGERCAVIIHGQRWELCLNDATARAVGEALLGPVDAQVALGSGEEIPLNASCGGIFGGKFARELEGLLSPDELIKLSEGQASNRACDVGSKGFNPFAHFALRCRLDEEFLVVFPVSKVPGLVDAPLVAQALTRRLRRLLPSEYPPQSGRQLLGVNQRLRFLRRGRVRERRQTSPRPRSEHRRSGAVEAGHTDPGIIIQRVTKASLASEILDVMLAERENPEMNLICIGAAWTRLAKHQRSMNSACKSQSVQSFVTMTQSLLENKSSGYARQVANIFWAVAKLQSRIPQLEGLQTALAGAIKSTAKAMNPQEVTNVIWAVATLSAAGANVEAWLQTECDKELLKVVAKKLSPTLGRITGWGLCALAWSYSQLDADSSFLLFRQSLAAEAKYVPGMHHSDHTDCAHEDEAGRSFLTVQLYLNDRFSGGRTTFISDRLVPIEPTPGKLGFC
ncbi:unnamed protein product [Effrenium voratum]|nr:unnamed protein product [Effrenium voratum]